MNIFCPLRLGLVALGSFCLVLTSGFAQDQGGDTELVPYTIPQDLGTNSNIKLVPYTTALQYLVVFWPRWYSYQDNQLAQGNGLFGPDEMSSVYHAIVAPNDDTLYANGFVVVTTEPQVVTIPTTPVTYSLLAMDVYGNAFETGIKTGPNIPKATYALCSAQFAGALPPNVTKVTLPFSIIEFIIRADKFSPQRIDQTAEAAKFRKSLRLESLTNYRINPLGGRCNIIPVAEFGVPFKTLADDLVARGSDHIP
jgi:hypothetical protein